MVHISDMISDIPQHSHALWNDCWSNNIEEKKNLKNRVIRGSDAAWRSCSLLGIQKWICLFSVCKHQIQPLQMRRQNQCQKTKNNLQNSSVLIRWNPTATLAATLDDRFCKGAWCSRQQIEGNISTANNNCTGIQSFFLCIWVLPAEETSNYKPLLSRNHAFHRVVLRSLCLQAPVRFPFLIFQYQTHPTSWFLQTGWSTCKICGGWQRRSTYMILRCGCERLQRNLSSGGF